MNIHDTFADAVAANGGATTIGGDELKDHDYSERFEAVVDQTTLLRIGLWSCSYEQVWQVEVAELADGWHAESGEPMPERRNYSQGYFHTFAAAMAAVCDVTRHIAAQDEFETV